MPESHPHYDFRTFGVPIAIHNDDVPAVGCGKSWSKLAECTSRSSMIARGPVQWINFCITLMFTMLAVCELGRDTFDLMWKHIAWSLLALYHGKFPTHDANGKEFKSGWQANMAGKALAEGFFHGGVGHKGGSRCYVQAFSFVQL